MIEAQLLLVNHHISNPYATLNVAPLVNSDAIPPFAPGALPLGLSNPYSLCASANAAVMGNLDVNFRLQVGGSILEYCCRLWGNFLAAKKDFDIPHPTKDDWRLRHVAPETKCRCVC